MSASDGFQTPPQHAADIDESVPEATKAVDGLTLGEPVTEAENSVLPKDLNGHASPLSDNAQDQPRPIGRVETNSAALQLPVSSKDAEVIKTPLGKPLDDAKPRTPPIPTKDQEARYKTLLERVEKWKEVPDSLTKGAKVSPIQEHERMFCTRECLLRYLRATSWKVDQAEKRLRDTLSWRREYGTDKLSADYISVENETGKQVILGWDAEGRPCCYLRPSKQNTERSDRQIEHLVYMLERTVDLMPPGQEKLALLINFAETKQGQGATLAQGKQTLYILQNHYPERLGRALVANVPFIIWTFFKLITPFIDPITREKIKFNEDMGLYVPREQLMKEANGHVDFEYDHKSYWPALTELARIKREALKERWKQAGSRIGEYEMYLRGGDQKPLVEVEKEAAAVAAA